MLPFLKAEALTTLFFSLMILEVITAKMTAQVGLGVRWIYQIMLWF